MSRSSSQRCRVPEKPPCLPGSSHYWILETAQKLTAGKWIGTSDGVCVYCEAQFTFFNSVAAAKSANNHTWGRQ